MPRKRKTPADEVDARVESILNQPGAELSPANAELSALLRVAVELRNLPRLGFREELDLSLRPPQALTSRDLREEVRNLTGQDAPRYLGSLDKATIMVT